MTDVFFDPVGGNDSNSGATGFPLQTWGENMRRYGGPSPVLPYGQSVIFHQLSAQPLGSDPIVWAPYLSGGGQTGLIVTPQIVHAAFAAGTVAPTQTGGIQATRITIAAMPTGAAAGVLVFNATRGSYAFIDSMSGSTATISQPLPSSNLTTIGIPSTSNGAQDFTWATGDSLVLYQCQASNLKVWDPYGVDVNASGQASVGFVLFAHIVDPSGVGGSKYQLNSRAAANTLSCCQIDMAVSQVSRGTYLLGCYVAGAVSISGGGAQLLGGICSAGVTVTGNDVVIKQSVQIHGTFANFGTGTTLGEIWSDGAWSVFAGMIVNFPLFGPFTLNVLPGATVWLNAPNVSGGANWVQVLQSTGTISFGTGTSVSTTGSYLTGSTWTDGVTLSAANIDAHGSLQDKQTGARFCGSA